MCLIWSILFEGKKHFFSLKYHNYVSLCTGAQESLSDKETLKPCEGFDLSKVQTPHDYQTAANSSETLEKIEECMRSWSKQIEQVGALQIKELSVGYISNRLVLCRGKRWVLWRLEWEYWRFMVMWAGWYSDAFSTANHEWAACMWKCDALQNAAVIIILAIHASLHLLLIHREK